MRTTVTASPVRGPCDRFYRALQETRAIFLLSVVGTIIFSIMNARMVYDSVIPSEPDYNSEHFLAIVSRSVSANSSGTVDMNASSPAATSNVNVYTNVSAAYLATKLPEWKTNMSRSILFVHVGKAGGETIKSVLSAGCRSRANVKRRNKCLQKLPNSTISDTVQWYFHCFKMPFTAKVTRFNAPPSAAEAASSYLYNLRHPVDRTISWYHYVSPKNCRKNEGSSPACGTAAAISQNPHNGWEAEFFGWCFPTIEDWAQALATPTPPTTTTSKSSTSNHTDCSELAWSSLAGNIDIDKHPVAAHMVANFRHYTNKTIARFPSKEVLVVRIEHMWHDLGNLDRLLGGNGDFRHLHGSSVTHGSEKHQERRSISESGAQLFCCALQDELRIFRDLTNRATNLDAETKLESSRKTVARCGLESWEDLQKQCESLVSPRVTG
jgi:hypothetical protein